jgi:hypothetical protein
MHKNKPRHRKGYAMKIRPHLIRIYRPGHVRPLTYRVRVKDATATITMTTTVAQVLAARPGQAIVCVGAKCCLANADLFPHAVYLVEFGRRYAYVVDKLNKDGHPISCRKYLHNYGGRIEIFDDKKGGKRKIIDLGLAETDIVLRPPYQLLGDPHLPTNGKRGSTGRPTRDADQSRKPMPVVHEDDEPVTPDVADVPSITLGLQPKLIRGAKRRYIEAGHAL